MSSYIKYGGGTALHSNVKRLAGPRTILDRYHIASSNEEHIRFDIFAITLTCTFPGTNSPSPDRMFFNVFKFRAAVKVR